MQKSNIEIWRELRELMSRNGFKAELEKAVTELHVIAEAVYQLDVDIELQRDGLAHLIETVGGKLADLAHGRTAYMLLPE